MKAEPQVAFVKESESRGERAKDEMEPSLSPSRGLQWLVGLGATLVAAIVVIVVVQVIKSVLFNVEVALIVCSIGAIETQVFPFIFNSRRNESSRLRETFAVCFGCGRRL